MRTIVDSEHIQRIFGWLQTMLSIPYGDGPKMARISIYKDRPPIVTRE